MISAGLSPLVQKALFGHESLQVVLLCAGTLRRPHSCVAVFDWRVMEQRLENDLLLLSRTFASDFRQGFRDLRCVLRKAPVLDVVYFVLQLQISLLLCDGLLEGERVLTVGFGESIFFSFSVPRDQRDTELLDLVVFPAVLSQREG